jgi:IclR family acetate operon transcriptional repressor
MTGPIEPHDRTDGECAEPGSRAGAPHRPLHRVRALAPVLIEFFHRIIGTLATSGYVRRLPSRRYPLGSRWVGLGDAATRMLVACRDRPQLVEQVGETAKMAMLDGDAVVHVVQVPSPHSMRMPPRSAAASRARCTGRDEVLLPQLPR